MNKKVSKETQTEGGHWLFEDCSNSELPQNCTICLDLVVARGKLSTCSHWFCFPCILEWSKNANTCPLCKTRFCCITKVQASGHGSPSRTVRVKDKGQSIVNDTADVVIHIISDDSDGVDDDLDDYLPPRTASQDGTCEGVVSRGKPKCFRRSSLRQQENFPHHEPLKANASFDALNLSAFQTMMLWGLQDVCKPRSSLDGDISFSHRSSLSSSSSGCSLEQDLRPSYQSRRRLPTFESRNLETGPHFDALARREDQYLPRKCASFPTYKASSCSWSVSSDGYQSEPLTSARRSVGHRSHSPQRLPINSQAGFQNSCDEEHHCQCTSHHYEKIDDFDNATQSFRRMSRLSRQTLASLQGLPYDERGSSQLLGEGSATLRQPSSILPSSAYGTPENDAKTYGSVTATGEEELIYVKMDGMTSCESEDTTL